MATVLCVVGAAMSAPGWAQEVRPQNFKRLAGDPGVTYEFGYAVAANGGRALVGARHHAENGDNAGAVYEFLFDAARREWNQSQKIQPSDGAAFDAFGTSVDVSAGWAVIGAPGAAGAPGVYTGAAYVYRFDSGLQQWVENARLVPADGVADARFGYAVAIDSTTQVAVVGAVTDPEMGIDAGAVYVFRRNPVGGVWEEEQKLLAHNTNEWDRFGTAVDIAGEVIAIGGLRASNFSGTAYVYRYDSTAGLWNEEAAFGSSDINVRDEFGNAVFLRDSATLVVGSWLDDNENGEDAGAAYIYAYNATTGTWDEVTKVISWDGRTSDSFGTSVSLSGTLLAVGAPFETNDEGAVYQYFYNVSAGTAEPRNKLVAADREAMDLLGWSVAANNVTVLAGAHWEDEGGKNAGAVYGYDLLPPPPFTLTTDPNPVVGGQEARFIATNGKADRKTYLAYSLRGRGETFVRQLNVTLDLARPEQLGGAVTADEFGRAEWVETLAPKLSGRTIWLQAAQVEMKTNLVEQVIQ